MQMRVSRPFCSTFPFYNPHHPLVKTFCVHTGYKSNQWGNTKITQWKQQSVLVNCSLTDHSGPQLLLQDFLSSFLLVLAALLSLLPPERQNSSLCCFKHLIRQALRLSAPCEDTHSPATTPWHPTPTPTGQLPSPMALSSRQCCQQNLTSDTSS